MGEMKTIALKVCGMRQPENIASLAELAPQYMGFIFYAKSPRYAADVLQIASLQELPEEIQKVGVFVNTATTAINEICHKFGIGIVQLHGDEKPVQCQELK